MLRQSFLLVVAIVLWGFSPHVAHDFHVSQLTINYVSSTGELQLTLDTFIDDVEGAVASLPAARQLGLSEREVNLLTDKEAPPTDSLIEAYLSDVIQLNGADTEPVRLQYLGKESAEDPYALYLYLKSGTGIRRENLSLISKYMLDRYDDQQNIVVWQIDGQPSDYDLLTASTRTSTFD